MNKTCHSSCMIRSAAAVACALAMPTASLARTVSVAAIRDGAATAAFGDADGAAYTLAWGYGPADGGAATNGWAHFETLGEVAADATSRTIALPAGWGDTATHLRFFLLEPELPAAATRVEYLESSGTQWINSGVTLYSNDTVVAEYANPAALLTKSVDLFGVHKHGMTARYVFSYDSSSGTTTMLFHRANGTQGATSTATDVTATPGTRQTVTMKIGPGTSSIVSASGETLFSKTLTSQTVKQDATAPLAIFACNSSQYGIMALSAAKIYSFRIYDENNVRRLDLVPCTVGGTPAMYDRVAGGYLTNVGTGDFATSATMATPLLVVASSATASTADYGAPDAYLDYVEATGEQYIDSECYLASNSVIVAEYAFSDPTVKKSDFLFGVYKRGMTASFFYNNGPIKFWKGTGTSSPETTDTERNPAQGVRQTVTMQLGSGTSTLVSASGETLYSGALSGTISQNATIPLFIFGLNNQGSFGSNYSSAAKIYSFLIYDGEENLVRHFLPCLKNNVAGFYDKVTGRIFRSATATALVAGPVLPRPSELVKWVQSDGADGSRGLYIDTGVPAKAGVGMVADMEWATKPAGYGVHNIFCGATDSSGKHIWLYDAVADDNNASATHRFGYYTWKLQLQSNSIVYAGKRYRVEAHQAHGDQYLSVFDLAGTGAQRSNGEKGWSERGTNRTLYLFANNNDGTAADFSHVRLYSLVLTNDLGVARDFVPCVADNGRAGLYDRVSERVFFPQAAKAGATSSDFDFATEVGAVTNVLAEAAAGAPAARLSYVESDGASDFVDLGIEARDGTKMVADLEWTVLPDDDVFCGARVATSGANSETRFYLYNAYGSSPLHAMGYGNGNATVSDGAGYVTLGTRYRIETTLEDGAQTSTVRRFADGAWSAASTRTAAFAGPMQLGIPLYLFARDLGGTADAFAAARVYSLKLWQKDGNGDYALVRDLVPAKTAGGAIGLYDRVTAGWLFNSGERYSLTGGTESTWIDGFYIRFR